MSPTPEITGTLLVVWDDETNRRVVHFDIDYAIEPFDPGDSTVTASSGPGVEILDVRAHAVFQYADGRSEWWLYLYAGSDIRPLPLDTAVKLVRDYRSSPQFNNIEDACRAHAESEMTDE